LANILTEFSWHVFMATVYVRQN